MAPESNHTSIRSEILFIGLPVSLNKTTSSINGLCKSDTSSVMRDSLTPVFLISAFSSSIVPIHFSSVPSSDFQMGNGVPQKRLRLKFQSTIFSSQFPKRPSPVDL